MSLAEEYRIALKEQKKLIVNLSGSGPSIPGLNVESVAARLAELDPNLQDSLKYYTELAARSEERLKSLDADDIETRESIERERKQALDDAEKISNEYVESQRDFIQEQIAIIEVNTGVIQGAVVSLPAAITAAGITSTIPTAVGAAVPNYLYNIGVLLQTLRGFSQTLKLIKTAFLNMLIASDKIKFVLPPGITGLLNNILNVEKLLGKSEKESERESEKLALEGLKSRVISKQWEIDSKGRGRFLIEGSNLNNIFKINDNIKIIYREDGRRNKKEIIKTAKVSSIIGNYLYINKVLFKKDESINFILEVI